MGQRRRAKLGPEGTRPTQMRKGIGPLFQSYREGPNLFPIPVHWVMQNWVGREAVI